MITGDFSWSINARLNIIKNFTPLSKPNFAGNDDFIHAATWGLYNRVCENIKSFTILFENQQYCDAFIMAGVALETCAKLSFIKDRDNIEQSRESYNKYLASITLCRLIYNLELYDDLKDEQLWMTFSALLKIFYPVGHSIFINKKSSYEDVIKTINYRLGDNKNKISLLKASFKELSVSRYTVFFFEKLKIYDADVEMTRYYKKYCEFKHCNIMSPGIFFEGKDDLQSSEIRLDIADDSLYLILGLMLYLKKYSSTPFL